MLTHVNLLAGARAVARYIENSADDRLLSLLPLSFDAGLSQLTCAFLVGATLVLQKVSMPAEIVRTLIEQRVTGMAAVPPVWIQIARYLDAAPSVFPHLRYLTNTGGAIPQTTLERLPVHFPAARIYLMYGLTEAFRSTYLPPARYADKRGAIGQAIPNVETFVIHAEGRPCVTGEEGELVHRGSLVSRGYWNKPDETAAKIRPCPTLRAQLGDEKLAWSGDMIRVDDDGDYWFVGRRDGLIKVSGFRISAEEVEEIVYRSHMIGHVVAFGVPDEVNGQAVEIAVTAADGAGVDETALLRYCRAEMPHYMAPRRIHHWPGEFPRTSSGKLDRPRIVRTALANPQES
jgi:acyl-CoA synthetase (AMP-forming)/AMP-acid ligase II